MTEDTTYKLIKPLQTHQGEVNSLTLKYPTARSFMNHGTPFTVIREGDEDNPRIEFKFNTKPMFKFIADMTGLDELTLADIHGTDVMPLFWQVANMLNNRPKNTST
jgi:hypothetical protein